MMILRTLDSDHAAVHRKVTALAHLQKGDRLWSHLRLRRPWTPSCRPLSVRDQQGGGVLQQLHVRWSDSRREFHERFSGIARLLPFRRGQLFGPPHDSRLARGCLCSVCFLQVLRCTPLKGEGVQTRSNPALQLVERLDSRRARRPRGGRVRAF